MPGLDQEEGNRIKAALDDNQPGVPSTDDSAGPCGKGLLSATAKSNTAVLVGPCRLSCITHRRHKSQASVTETCSYIVGSHRWTIG